MTRFVSLVLGVALCLAAVDAMAQDQATKSLQAQLRKQIEGHSALGSNVKTFVVKNLLPSTATPAWIQAVEAQNAKGMSQDQIVALDGQWRSAEEMLPVMEAAMSGPCAEEVIKLAKRFPAIVEAFVTDNQGANVCQNALTSDYWQGDEGKWKNSYNGGKGGVDAGAVEFDKSANTNLQQVSLPIIGQGGKVIGAVTFGLTVDSI